MERLPLEVLVEVLKELGIAELYRMAAVSRRWHYMLSNNELQRMVFGRLSVEQPFLHAQALYTGMPHSITTFEIPPEHRASLQLVIGIVGHRVLIVTGDQNSIQPLHRMPLLSLDLMTGGLSFTSECYYCGCVISLESYYSLLPGTFALAQFNGKLCQWTPQGVFTTRQSKPEYAGINTWYGIMDDRYAYLLSWDPGLWLMRTRLDDMQNDYFHFDCQGSMPYITAAGDAYLVTTSGDEARQYLLRLDQPSLRQITSKQFNPSVWRGVAYTVVNGAIHARSLDGRRLTARIVDDWSTHLSMNDSYLVGFRRLSDAYTVYSLDPELATQEKLHRTHPSRLIALSRSYHRRYTPEGIWEEHEHSSNMSSIVTGLELNEPALLGDEVAMEHFLDGQLPEDLRKFWAEKR